MDTLVQAVTAESPALLRAWVASFSPADAAPEDPGQRYRDSTDGGRVPGWMSQVTTAVVRETMAVRG